MSFRVNGKQQLTGFCVTVLACGVIAIATSALAEAPAFRTWSDASGKFKLKAKFVSVDKGMVTLEQEEGSELEIEVKKLTAADQKYVADAAKAGADNPFKSKANDPFKPKAKSGTGTPKTKKPAAKKSAAEPDDDGEEESGSGQPKELKIDWSSAALISLQGSSAEWKIDVPAAPEVFDFKPKNCALPPKSNFFEGMKGLALSPKSKKAVVGYHIHEPKPAGTTRLVICDLSTGKAGKSATTSGLLMPLAFHEDGQQILMRRDEFGFGVQDRLEVWKVQGTKINKLFSCIPYADIQGAGRDVMWAEFIDGERLATSSRSGKIAIWSYPEMQPLCSLGTVDGAVPALSPDHQWIGFCNGTEVGLLDIAKQEVNASAATPQRLQWPYLAFSPSGKQLGCIATDKALAWNVANGELEQLVPCTGIHVHGAIEFPDENFILGNGHFLIDIQNQLKLWHYHGHEQVRCLGGWCFFGITDGNNPGALGVGQMPHPAVKELVKKALTQSDLFVLKAGTAVKLNTDGIPDATQRAGVQQALTKRLQEIKCTADPNGTIELVAFVEGPKEQTIRYSTFGRFGGSEHKIQEYLTRLKFVYQGQPVWETQMTNVPHFISLKEGETIASHLQSREKPEYAFYEKVELPKLLQKPAPGDNPAVGSQTLGSSQVTTSGLK